LLLTPKPLARETALNNELRLLLQRSVAEAEEEAGAEEEAAVAAQWLLWLNCCALKSLRVVATAHAKSGRKSFGRGCSPAEAAAEIAVVVDEDDGVS
jgi:hypothetical protein